MNILYIIGNGFDLAQGFNTRYADFYKYYQKCASPNEAVKQLKRDIKENAGDWSDMELALGRFSEKVNSESEFSEMYFDLSERLSEYLSQETKTKQLDRTSKITSDLFLPFRYLEPLDQRFYLAYSDKFPSDKQKHNHVNIITLNYTDTIERLVEFSKPNSTLVDNTVYSIDTICHRHGTLDDTILIGVNDEQQISKVSFKENQAVKNLLVKPMAIDAMRSDNDLVCKELIGRANVIILFGVSLGATDACLWKDVVDRMGSPGKPLLLYFHYSSVRIPKSRKQLLGIKEAEAREFLYSRLKMPEELQDNERVLIGYDKDIFKAKAGKEKTS